MADFCYDFDPGGLGGHHPMGNFAWALTHFTLVAGQSVMLGICEGHGCLVFLEKTTDGITRFVHEDKSVRPKVILDINQNGFSTPHRKFSEKPT